MTGLEIAVSVVLALFVTWVISVAHRQIVTQAFLNRFTRLPKRAADVHVKGVYWIVRVRGEREVYFVEQLNGCVYSVYWLQVEGDWVLKAYVAQARVESPSGRPSSTQDFLESLFADSKVVLVPCGILLLERMCGVLRRVRF